MPKSGLPDGNFYVVIDFEHFLVVRVCSLLRCLYLVMLTLPYLVELVQFVIQCISYCRIPHVFCHLVRVS